MGNRYACGGVFPLCQQLQLCAVARLRHAFAWYSLGMRSEVKDECVNQWLYLSQEPFWYYLKAIVLV